MQRRLTVFFGLMALAALLVGAFPMGAAADTTTPATQAKYLNDLRASVGAPATLEDSRIDAAAQHHADYNAMNNIVGHYETAGAAGYTGYAPRDRLAAQGYYAQFVSEVATSFSGWQNGMTQLWAAPYHRLGMMHPHNVAQGWGHSTINAREATVGDFVYNFGTSAPVVREPAPGASGAPTSWNGIESPNPLPAGVSGPVGYPIMLVEPNAKTTVLRGAWLVRASDGAQVPLYLGTQQFEYDYAFVIPQRPLQAGTTYRVHFDLTLSGQQTSDEWSFTTSGDGLLHLTSFHTAWLGQSDPGPLQPGQTATVTLRFTNTGTETWQKGVSGKQVNLGVVGDSTAFAGMSVNWLSANRVATTVEQSVAPGATGTFTFQVQAPAAPGTYKLPLRPVIDGVAWLDDQGVYVPVVVDGGSFHSAWAGQSAYPTVAPGQVTTLMVQYRNTGTTTWVRGVDRQQVNLGVSGDDTSWASYGLNWMSANRIATTQESSVAAGGTGTFTFQMRAPSAPGTYDLRVRLVVDGVAWLEDQGVFLRIVVTP